MGCDLCYEGVWQVVMVQHISILNANDDLWVMKPQYDATALSAIKLILQVKQASLCTYPERSRDNATDLPGSQNRVQGWQVQDMDPWDLRKLTLTIYVFVLK